MTGMKYIVVEVGGTEEAVLFPQWWNHKEVAERLELRHIVSAGFISRDRSGRLNCAGESVGLWVNSRPVEDLDLILRLFSFNL